MYTHVCIKTSRGKHTAIPMIFICNHGIKAPDAKCIEQIERQLRFNGKFNKEQKKKSPDNRAHRQMDVARDATSASPIKVR